MKIADNSGSAPTVAPTNGSRGAPGSFFRFSTVNLPPNARLVVQVNGRQVTAFTVPSNGQYIFILFFINGAPSGVYRVGLVPSSGLATAASLAETTITLDPTAPVLPNPGDGEVSTGSLSIYLPYTGR